MPDANGEQSIFLAALELKTSAERAAYLKGACGDDAALLANVQRLLAAHGQGGSLLDNPPLAGPATSEQHLITERPGTVTGPYKLMEQIGEGGMGLVFVAEQQQPVRRKVALKIIKPGMDSARVIARFEAERQALAMMDHQHIARVFDAGTTDTGRPYFVMELVHGVPITDYCDANHLTPRQRLELFIPVCQAIQHAHQKGVIHRDIKPSNVLVTMYDDKPVPKVIDFGVAKAVEQRLTEKTVYTQFGTLMGTFEYMSPEQAEMNAFGVDTRSDIYSLGVLLYELLTGTTPLERARLREAAYGEIVRLIREEEAPWPSVRLSTSGLLAKVAAVRKTDPRKLSRLVRGELDWVVMRCLEKDRTRRYETASGLARDVERYLKDEPVEARLPSVGYRLRKFVRRNKGPMLMAATVLVALVAGVIGTTWGWVEALSQRDDTEHARKEEAEQRRIALTKEAEALRSAKQADLARQKAEANETKAEWRLYASCIASAQREWETHNPALLYHYLHQCRADFRGWEHDFLYTLANQNHQTLRGHKQEVTCVAFSPDGKRLAGASSHPGAVKVWELASGREVLTHKVPGVRSVAFSPDGKHLATTSIPAKEGGTGLGPLGEVPSTSVLTVWDASSFKMVWAVEENPSLGIDCIAFSPDGKRLAAASQFLQEVLGQYAGTVRVRDAASGKEIMTLKWPDPVKSLAFSPDGKLLAGATTTPIVIAPDDSQEGGIGLVKLWDATSGKEVRTLEGETSSVAFSPGGKHLAGVSYSNKRGPGMSDLGADYAAKVWDVASGEELVTFTGHTPNNTLGFFGAYGSPSVAYSPDGKLLAVGLDLWEVATGKKAPMTFKGHAGSLTSVAFSPDGKRLASASEDKTVKVWDLAGTPGPLTITAGWGQPTQSGMGSVFSPDGKLAIAAGDTVKMFDAANGQEVQTLVKVEPITGKRLASVSHLSFSPDGKQLAGYVDVFSTHDLDAVKVWDAATGQEVLSLKGEPTDRVSCVAFSPDGKRLATGANNRNGLLDFTVRVWDAATGQEVLTLKGQPTSRGFCVAFSPDGKLLATAAHNQGLPRVGAPDCTVKVWDSASGQEILTLNARGIVFSMAFSPDGKRLATGGGPWSLDVMPPGEVKFWDVATGQEVLTLKGHTSRVKSVAFSPDGKRLASGSLDKTVRLWDAASGQEALTLRGNTGSVESVAFSPDGKRLACASAGTLTIRDATKSMKEAGQQ